MTVTENTEFAQSYIAQATTPRRSARRSPVIAVTEFPIFSKSAGYRAAQMTVIFTDYAASQSRSAWARTQPREKKPASCSPVLIDDAAKVTQRRLTPPTPAPLTALLRRRAATPHPVRAASRAGARCD